jgi:hypothetical protein
MNGCHRIDGQMRSRRRLQQPHSVLLQMHFDPDWMVPVMILVVDVVAVAAGVHDEMRRMGDDDGESKR